MFISAARRKLNAAIEAATDPLVIAQLTVALSRLYFVVRSGQRD